jgi:hypothetical protein
VEEKYNNWKRVRIRTIDKLQILFFPIFPIHSSVFLMNPSLLTLNAKQDLLKRRSYKLFNFRKRKDIYGSVFTYHFDL